MNIMVTIMIAVMMSTHVNAAATNPIFSFFLKANESDTQSTTPTTAGTRYSSTCLTQTGLSASPSSMGSTNSM